jgi:hypothetical protein
MAQYGVHPPARLLLAAFSRHTAVLDWALARATDAWGPIALASEPFDFAETDYYGPTMGHGLKKIFWVFGDPFDPGVLADLKRSANRWEDDCVLAVRQRQVLDNFGNPIVESRPLNLDPGYLTTAKLVLASTKDHAHRIYLRDGIYAEITLFFRHGRWEHHEWTFPDYRRPDYQRFFTQVRDHLKSG